MGLELHLAQALGVDVCTNSRNFFFFCKDLVS